MMRKIFGNLKMTWVNVLIFALAAGVYTGLIMLVPFLKDTSFQDIGISYEWWVIFAVIIAVNCKNAKESMLKIFVFFLISQPLVYAVEIAAGKLAFDLAWMYYRNMWLPMTFATLPGGLIAYFSKSEKAIGAVILGLGNTIQLLLGIVYLIMAYADFPHHILSAITCFASAAIMSLFIQNSKRGRAISLILPFALSAIIIIACKAMGLYLISGIF